MSFEHPPSSVCSPIVSRVSSATDIKPTDVDAVTVIDQIKTGVSRESIEEIRARYAEVLAETNDFKEAKRKVASLKRTLPAVMWAGQFSTRGATVPAEKRIVVHSGLLAADLDQVPSSEIDAIRERLGESPHVWAVFLSPTGTGLKVVFRVTANPAAHDGNFDAVAEHVLQLCGLPIDPACRDLGRLCFVSFDPLAHLNTAATVLPLRASPSARPKRTHSDLKERKRIAEEQLGRIDWEPDSSGFCECPGRGLHTSPNGPRDCRIHVDGVPTIYCFHGSCTQRVEEANRRLRLRFTEEASLAPTSATSRVRRGSTTAEYLEDSDETSDTRTPFVLAASELAKLSPAGYDRVRKSRAKQLNVRVGTLDLEVEKRRADQATKDARTSQNIGPWPDPVAGGELLARIRTEILRFCWLPEHYASVLAVWILQTYVYEVFTFCAIVVVHSPEPQCGKGRVLEVVAKLTRNPFLTSNTSAAVLYHKVAAGGLTVLVDELDSQSEEQQFAIGNVLKSGFQSNGTAHRMAEMKGKMEVVEFPTFCPKIVASIGLDSLDKASRSRAISIPMSRKPKSAGVEKFRRYDGSAIRAQCQRWADDNREALSKLGSIAINECATDRQEDIWEPLLAIAQRAGGDWERKIRSACREICSSGDGGKESWGHTILSGCAEYFRGGNDRVTSTGLCEWLNENTDLGEAFKGKGIQPRGLADALRPYNICPGTIRTGEATFKGYSVASFEAAFTAYLPEKTLPAAAPADSCRHNVTRPVIIGPDPLLAAVTEPSCDGSKKSPSCNTGGGCDGVTDGNARSPVEEGIEAGQV